ncbi:MAG: hypothetical protein FH749_08320 [Firmicutes bacterium]|nr:hypothetical protein [Bacillota bacterium]
MNWLTWFRDLGQLGANTMEAASTHNLVGLFLDKMGWSEYARNWTFKIMEQPIGGWVCPVSVPDDIRILLKPTTNLNQLAILLHELGHAMYHTLNTASGLGKLWTDVENETSAIITEHIGLEIMLTSQELALVRELRLLETVRCAISFQFEDDLNQQPECAEALYHHHYGRLLPVEDPTVWALDSFRSIDPVYIHNYVLGAITAEHVLADLRKQFGEDYLAWGAQLSKWRFVHTR